jgi:hypothetical protein
MTKFELIDVDPAWLAEDEKAISEERKANLLSEFQDGLIAGAVSWLEAGGYDEVDIDSMVHNFLEEYEIADYGDHMDVHWHGELFIPWETIQTYLTANEVTLAEFRTILAERQFEELPELWECQVKPYSPAKPKTKRQKKVARPKPTPIVVTNETTILVAIKKQPRRLI